MEETQPPDPAATSPAASIVLAAVEPLTDALAEVQQDLTERSRLDEAQDTWLKTQMGALTGLTQAMSARVESLWDRLSEMKAQVAEQLHQLRQKVESTLENSEEEEEEDSNEVEEEDPEEATRSESTAEPESKGAESGPKSEEKPPPPKPESISAPAEPSARPRIRKI